MHETVPSTTETSLDRAAATTSQYRTALEACDLERLLATMAPDVVVHSPLSMRARFDGRDEVRELLRAVFATVGQMRFHTDVGDERTRVLFHSARVGGQDFEETTLVRLDEQARIAEVTLWIRPLPGITAMMAELGPRLARQYGRPCTAVAVSALTKPLVFMTRVGDRFADSLVKSRTAPRQT